eukprot:2053550-Rhodomonas_salina.1
MYNRSTVRISGALLRRPEELARLSEAANVMTLMALGSDRLDSMLVLGSGGDSSPWYRDRTASADSTMTFSPFSPSIAAFATSSATLLAPSFAVHTSRRTGATKPTGPSSPAIIRPRASSAAWLT